MPYAEWHKIVTGQGNGLSIDEFRLLIFEVIRGPGSYLHDRIGSCVKAIAPVIRGIGIQVICNGLEEGCKCVFGDLDNICHNYIPFVECRSRTSRDRRLSKLSVELRDFVYDRSIGLVFDWYAFRVAG